MKSAKLTCGAGGWDEHPRCLKRKGVKLTPVMIDRGYPVSVIFSIPLKPGTIVHIPLCPNHRGLK